MSGDMISTTRTKFLFHMRFSKVLRRCKPIPTLILDCGPVKKIFERNHKTGFLFCIHFGYGVQLKYFIEEYKTYCDSLSKSVVTCLFPSTFIIVCNGDEGILLKMLMERFRVLKRQESVRILKKFSRSLFPVNKIINKVIKVS